MIPFHCQHCEDSILLISAIAAVLNFADIDYHISIQKVLKCSCASLFVFDVFDRCSLCGVQPTAPEDTAGSSQHMAFKSEAEKKGQVKGVKGSAESHFVPENEEGVEP